MLKHLIEYSLANRFLIIVATLLIAGLGTHQLRAPLGW